MPPIFLEISNLSFGFQNGLLYELRFDIELPHAQGLARMKLQGPEKIQKALNFLQATSEHDIKNAYAHLKEQNHILQFEGYGLVSYGYALATLEHYTIHGNEKYRAQAAQQARQIQLKKTAPLPKILP